MCKMLLSINPKHVENIINGNKRFEFRKVRCRKEVDTIIIYATSPIMKVIGEAQVLDVIEDVPEQVWTLTAQFAGITKPFYDKYYQDRKKAVAYKLGDVKQYKTPRRLSDFGIGSAPQSFVYIGKS